MSAQVVMRQMSVLLMALGLSACVGMTVQPAVSKNYQLTLVNPDRNSRGGVLEDDAADAYAAHLAEKDVLWTSNEPVLLKWRQELDQLKGKSQLEQLRGVNDLVNGSVHYKSDYEHWRRLDRWGHSRETLMNGGDCEDFAILKAVSLNYLGWQPDSWAVLVGFSSITVPPGGHAILIARLDNGAQVLLDSASRDLSTPADDVAYYPAYALTPRHIYKVTPIASHPVPAQLQDQSQFAQINDAKSWGLKARDLLPAGQSPDVKPAPVSP